MGGNLILNSNNITGTGNININGTIGATGGLSANLSINSYNITGTGNISTSGNISASALGANLALGGYAINGSGSISITGNISASALGANLALGGNSINGTGNINITGAINGTSLGGALSTAAKPNITSLGTLTGLTTSGNVTIGAVTYGSDLTNPTITVNTFLGALNIGTTSTPSSLSLLVNPQYEGIIVKGALNGSPGLGSQQVPTVALYSYKGTNESPTILTVGDSAGSFGFFGFSNAGTFGTQKVLLGAIDCVTTTLGDAVSVFPQSSVRLIIPNGFNPAGAVYAQLKSSGVFTAQSLLATGVGGVGYGPSGGSTGGAITQITSRITPVTLNTICGSITLFSTTTTAGQITSFSVSNTTVAATDVVNVSIKTATGIYMPAVTTTSAGSFIVSIFTPSAVVAAEAPVLNFVVIKSVAS